MPYTIDPDFAPVLPAPDLAAARTPAPARDVTTLRTSMNQAVAHTLAANAVPADVTRTDHHATAADGTTILLRWYAKDGAAPGSAVLFLHGGGMISGSVDAFDTTVARYVSASGVPMLSAEYRLAPEHPYPAPLEDACTALTWLHEHAGDLGVDPNRIAVLGESAGGGLAATLAVLARDRGGPAIARQILIQAMLDDRATIPDDHLPPYVIWSHQDHATVWQAYLGDLAESPDLPATAAAARLTDPAGLPPAYLEIGQLDILRDENIAYATLLGRAGIDVELHVHPGVPHGFDQILPHSDIARRATADRVRVLRSV
ncbi:MULTISPECIES: alpha/beta hydrolase [Catenuloplanes]|uniref:Acetyl esterase/lipase n=1 Tax=Catenuloplanes niger TaxID=587534 RepID=A0AAE3ZK81_9ACTN|nr:alpha/beta hydrolase [Catenuloplanes niger]MDR7320746.1 acetyl esterase/lipase [Catenuloplanes niger]